MNERDYIITASFRSMSNFIWPKINFNNNITFLKSYILTVYIPSLGLDKFTFVVIGMFVPITIDALVA